MRTCPRCHTQYTDDTLRFCLQDGTPLASPPPAHEPTAPLDTEEFETAPRRPKPPAAGVPDSVETQWTPQSQVTRVPQRKAAPSAPFRIGLGVAAAVAVFLLGAIVALGIWLYFRPPDVVVKNTDNGKANHNGSAVNINVNSPVTPTPRVVISPTPFDTLSNINGGSRAPYPELTPLQVDKEQAAKQVSQEIQGWLASSEKQDLDAIMSRYADSVDYYRRNDADRGFIRADKQRAYRLYDTIIFRVSDMNVSVSDSGDSATAVFDKEWMFTGRRSSFGRVQQQLQFRRINGQWLITGERDLKVYYTN